MKGNERMKEKKEMNKQKCLQHDGKGEEKQSDIIINLAKNCKYFKNELSDPFVAAFVKDHYEVMGIKSQKFKLYLTKLYFENTKSAPSSEAMNQSLKVLEMKAMYSENEHQLQKRISKFEESYFYDLCNPKWIAVKIDKNRCSIEVAPPILFTRSNNMKEQTVPDFKTKPDTLLTLVNKHFRLKKESDVILFSTYLVTCFLPDISHVILVLYGEKGSAKSTSMRMIKKLVDPAIQDLLSIPTSTQDLALILANNYLPCFDNLDSISPEKSNLLCMASTGGALSKRTLYTDSDETILRIKRPVVLNGINIVATRADLLDRSIVIELERIHKTQRKTEKQIWKQFDTDIPKFLGAIFNTISAAISLYDDVSADEFGRMADFNSWGHAIAEVLGVDGDAFQQSYLDNQSTANKEAIESHPIASAIIILMDEEPSWQGSVTSLLKELQAVAYEQGIDTNNKLWVKSANVLSRRLREIKSNLSEIGITYNIKHAGSHKEITILNELLSK